VTPEARSQLRIAWSIVACTAIAGFAAVVAPAERRIGALEAHAAELAALADRNAALVARIGSLEQTRSSVHAELARLAGAGGRGRIAASILSLLDGEARGHHVSVTSIAPASAQPSARDSGREEDVSVTLRGRYRDVMAAVADVPHHDVLIEVLDVSLARVDARGLFPNVDATVRVALYPSTDDLLQEESHARAPAH